jgi:hypothetical protein
MQVQSETGTQSKLSCGLWNLSTHMQICLHEYTSCNRLAADLLTSCQGSTSLLQVIPTTSYCPAFQVNLLRSYRLLTSPV